jgi:hypothetical protein
MGTFEADMHERGEHSGCDPDKCFAAKMHYWRRNGVKGIVTKPMLTGEKSIYQSTRREWIEENVGIDNIKAGKAVPVGKAELI